MSDFLRAMLGGMGKEDEVDGDDIDAVYSHAIKASRAAATDLIKQSQRYTTDGGYFRAALFLFVCVWTLVGHVYRGVEKSIENHGPHSEVAKLWHLIRIALSGGHTTEATVKTLAKMETFDEDFNGGKYDDVH
jgi:hypothetical protein